MFWDSCGSITVRLGLIGLVIISSLNGQTSGPKPRFNKAKATDILIEAEGLEKNEKARLLVFLHGMGGSPQGLEKALAQMAKERKFTVFLPCGSVQLNFMRDGFPGFNYDPEKDPKTIARKVKQIKGIDRNKIYLAGFSAGAIMSYIMGTEDPDLYSGVIAFGGEVQERALNKVAVRKASGKLPIFIVHGTMDEVMPIQLGREAYDYFKSRKYRVMMKEFEGGHFIPADFADIIESAVAWFNGTKGLGHSGG